jgi:hypothetical protein
LKQLEVKKFRVKQSHAGGPEEAPSKEPSFSSFFNFSWSCGKCKYKHEFYYPQRGVYNEADLLKIAQMSFNFANKEDCGCHEQKEEPEAT